MGIFREMNGPWNTKSRFVGDVHALSFHGSPARVALLLQAARGRHAQLQARCVDDLGPGAIQAEIPFERVDDVVERRRGASLLPRGRPRQCTTVPVSSHAPFAEALRAGAACSPRLFPTHHRSRCTTCSCTPRRLAVAGSRGAGTGTFSSGRRLVRTS